MTQGIGEAVVTKRFVHQNGTVSHFHIRAGRVLLTSVHPEHAGNPGELERAELLRAWDKVTEDAEAEGLLG